MGTDPGIANVVDFAGAITGEIDGKPVAGNFSEVGRGHSHAHGTPHVGVVAALQSESGEEVGFAELKLHDDKGDLELWLAKDREITQPIDIPADSVIEMSFSDVPGNLRLSARETISKMKTKTALRIFAMVPPITSYFLAIQGRPLVG